MTWNLIDPQTKQKLLKWYDVITKQNCFVHNEQRVIQHDGLAMGAQSSGPIAEIFLQHKEYSHLICLTHKHKILNYCRYVDDILLIFNSSHTEIQKILDDFSSLHHKLQFTAETEKGWTTLTYPHTEPPQTWGPPYTENPRLQTPSSPSPPIIPHTTSTQQLHTYTTDSTLTTYNTKNIYPMAHYKVGCSNHRDDGKLSGSMCFFYFLVLETIYSYSLQTCLMSSLLWERVFQHFSRAVQTCRTL